jgi:hypothetical protein
MLGQHLDQSLDHLIDQLLDSLIDQRPRQVADKATAGLASPRRRRSTRWIG